MANISNIRKRSDGRWEARIQVGTDNVTGAPVRKSIYGKTQKEVREKLTAMQYSIDHDEYHEPCKMLYSQWLDLWMERYCRSRKPATLVNYNSHIRNQIKPGLGDIPLYRLTSERIQDFYNSLELSPKSVKDIHGIVHKSLKQAVINGHIQVNPADGGRVELPKQVKPEIAPLDTRTAAAFLKAIKGHRFENVFLFALLTGCRRGEICGLTWDCVDFEHGKITIRQQLAKDTNGCFVIAPTKTDAVREIIPAQTVMDALRRQKTLQKGMKQASHGLWQDRSFVFSNEIGDYLSPHTLYHNFKRVAASIGVPDARFHDLRHTFATLSIQAGDDLKTVQNNLGHSTITTTMNTYAHVNDDMKRASANRMQEFIDGVTNLA